MNFIITLAATLYQGLTFREQSLGKLSPTFSDQSLGTCRDQILGEMSSLLICYNIFFPALYPTWGKGTKHNIFLAFSTE